MKKIILLAFFLFLNSVFLFAGPLEKGFEALKIYDYFHAKELFEKSFKNHPAGSSFGLSTIFYRSDNPFSNIDSAYKYILISEKGFKSSDAKEKEILLKVSINLVAINDLKEKIIQKAFEKAKTENTIDTYNWFIKQFHHHPLKNDAMKLRNKLAFEDSKKINTPQSYKDFIATNPDADEIKDAQWLYEFTLFNSMTKQNNIETYDAFVKKFPKSPYRFLAEDSLFSFSTRNETIEEYHRFLKKYSDNHNAKKAWDKIYFLSTVDFTPKVISKF